jgi:hypothetical protein
MPAAEVHPLRFFIDLCVGATWPGTLLAHCGCARNPLSTCLESKTTDGMSVGCRCEDQIVRSQFPVTCDSVTVLDHSFLEADF